MGIWPLPKGPSLTLGTIGPSLLGLRLTLAPEHVITHKHVMGLTGQGKSKLLASMFVQLLSQGEAAALIDPHGDLAADILSLCLKRGFFNSIGSHERLLYVDFSDRGRFLPFNVLQQSYPPHDVARHVVEACKRAWPALPDGAAPQFENILLAAAYALVENRCPLTDLPRLLTDKLFREALLRRVSDPAVVGFFS